MAFMQPEYDNDDFVEIKNKHGERTLCPVGYEDLGDGEEIVERFTGKWFFRLSAPGYMDCTDWNGPYDTEIEAREELSRLYDVDLDTGDDTEDTDEDVA